VLVLEPDVGPEIVMNEVADTLHVQPEEVVKLIETDPLPPLEGKVYSLLPLLLVKLEKAHTKLAFAAGAA
jgi:hypothetical protein